MQAGKKAKHYGKIDNFRLYFYSKNEKFASIPRDIFLEKHWRSFISRSVCDYFLDAQRVSPNVNDLPSNIIKVALPQTIRNFNKFGFFVARMCRRSFRRRTIT